MKKFIPAEKLAKKARRELNSQKRNVWGTLNPVTRVPAGPGIHNRKKLRKEDRDPSPELFLSGTLVFYGSPQRRSL